MYGYYTVITVLTWMSLGVLCILVQENGRIARGDKVFFILTYILIAVSALAEWLGVTFDGRVDLPKWPLMVIKCCDYILTPIAGGTLLAQMKIRRPRLLNALFIILAVNAVFQIVSCFFGWVFTIDNARHYTHGPLYFIYVDIYLTVVLLVIVGFVSYGKSFSRQNKTSLYAVLLLIIGGVAMQELLDRDIRTAYITLTLSAALLYIHYTEFSQQASDEHIREQQILITTDALTGVYSRFAYTQALEQYTAMEAFPKDLTVFCVDLNNLKPTNDLRGHAAGDELICAAARCIEKVFGGTGRCYRTGGDEFVVLACLKENNPDLLYHRLKSEAAAWKGKLADELSISAGYAKAADHSGKNLEDVVREADLIMYADKSEYYRRTGRDRRRRAPES